MSKLFDRAGLQIVVNVPAGEAGHHGALVALLAENEDDFNLYGTAMVGYIHHWLDILADNLTDNDSEALAEVLEMVLSRVKRTPAIGEGG